MVFFSWLEYGFVGTSCGFINIFLLTFLELVFLCYPQYDQCEKGHEPKASLRGPMILDDFYYAFKYSSLSACTLKMLVQCFISRGAGSFQRAILSGKIENHLLPCNALFKKLAFAICLHGNTAITLQDINISLPYKCSFLVSLFVV